MRIAIAGATGILGQQVVPRLLERGHKVRALVRREEQSRDLRRTGVEPVSGDILEAATLPALVEGADVVLHLATAIPDLDASQDWSLNDRIRREGTRHLLAASGAAGVARYIQQSVTLVYGERGAELADESSPLQPFEILESAVDMEARVRESGLNAIILRGGLYYGAGADLDRGWRKDARAGELRLPGDGDALISLVHVADMARAVVAATEATTVTGIYNVVDDEPVTYGELLRFVAALEGSPEPQSGGQAFLPSLGVKNDLIKEILGWNPQFRSFRSGLATETKGEYVEDTNLAISIHSASGADRGDRAGIPPA